MKPICLLLILLAFNSLGNVFAQTDKHTIQIVAHRGAKKFAPENTIAAFLKADEMGADYCEMDVRTTKDGYLVIMHDRSVDRTTDGNGLVKNMTLEEIKQLDAGSYFREEFKGERVPTFREVLKALKGKIIPDIDMKDADPAQVVKLLEEEGYLGNVAVTFYNGNWEKHKEILRLTDQLLIRPPVKGGENGHAELMRTLNPPLINLEANEASKSYLTVIHESGAKGFVNCLRGADKKGKMQKAIKNGADYIQADNLDILIPLVQKYNNR